MTLQRARLLVVIVGILLPYLARLPRGWDWVLQYAGNEAGAWAFLAAFNAIAWLAILACTLFYRRPVSVLAPAIAGFGFLAAGHFMLDLSADAQAALGLVFLPIYALVPIAIGGVVGWLIDRRLRRASAGTMERH